MITAMQMLANLAKRFEGDVLVEKIGPYKFAIRDEKDGGRAQYIFSYKLDCLFDEKNQLVYNVVQTIERCNYSNSIYPDCRFDDVESDFEVEKITNEIAARLQAKDAELAALRDSGIFLATIANNNRASSSKSQLQNQDFVTAGLIEEGVDEGEFLPSFFESTHKLHSEKLPNNEDFQNSGAVVSCLIFDAEKKVAHIATLGDAVTLAFGYLEDGTSAIAVVTNSMNGKNQYFYDKMIGFAKQNGYEQNVLDGGKVELCAQGKKKFFLAKGRRIAYEDVAMRGARLLGMLAAVGDKDFDGVLLKEPHLQSFCDNDVGYGFKTEFLVVACDGVEKFLRQAGSRYHVFVPKQDGVGYDLQNADQDKSELHKKWNSPEALLVDISDDLAGEDDLSFAALEVQRGKGKTFLLAGDGHGKLGGHVAYLLDQNIRSNAAIKILTKEGLEFDVDEQSLVPYFLQNSIEELEKLKARHFASLDLSCFEGLLEKDVEELSMEEYCENVKNVLAKQSEVKQKMHQACVEIERQLCKILNSDEGGFLKKDDDLKVSFFATPDVVIFSGENGFCFESEAIDFSRQIEIFEDIKSRFIKSAFEKNPTIFESRPFNKGFELLLSNIVADGERIAILKDVKKDIYQFVKISKLENDKILEVLEAGGDEFVKFSSMFVDAPNLSSVAKVAAVRVARGDLMQVSSL